MIPMCSDKFRTYVNDPGVLEQVAPFWQAAGVPAFTWHSFTSVPQLWPWYTHTNTHKESGCISWYFNVQYPQFLILNHKSTGTFVFVCFGAGSVPVIGLTAQLLGHKQWYELRRFRHVPPFWQGLLLQDTSWTVYGTKEEGKHETPGFEFVPLWLLALKCLTSSSVATLPSSVDAWTAREEAQEKHFMMLALQCLHNIQ